MYELDKDLDNKIAEDASGFYQCIKKIYAATGYDKEYPLNFFWGGENMYQLMKIERLFCPYCRAYEKVYGVRAYEKAV